MAGPDPAPSRADEYQDAGSIMLTAEAVVQTANSARYIARLCRHASQMSAHAAQPGRHLRHRPRGLRGGDAPPEVRHAEWSGTEGTVTLNWGRWTLQAGDRTLTVRAEAADEQNLQRIQDLLTTRLKSFGRREHLAVNWQRPPAASQPGPARP
jgi:hypothetical protein